MLRGGHVIDPRNKIDAIRDVAIRGGKIAAVAEKIDPAEALKAVDVRGLYVTPGLVDIHVHVFAGTGERRSYAGDNSVYPDDFAIRSGVTSVADAGCAGWRNFEDFKKGVIDRSRTRVFAFLNIVGHGMRGSRYEQDVKDMDPKPAAEMALRHKGLIVGIKTAHYSGRDYTGVERAVEAGTLADIPVMVDFGRVAPTKSLQGLLTQKLRPGDIYTHVYSGLRTELDPSGHANPALFEGRKRGVIFDVGHGGGSFAWRVAVPIIHEGFLPDSISTDLHATSQNASVKDMLNVMSKFLALGMSARRGDLALDLEPGPRDQARATGTPLGRSTGGRRRAPARAGRLRLPGLLRCPPPRQPEADLRDDATGRQDRLRTERPVPPGLDHAAQELPVHGQFPMGWEPELHRRRYARTPRAPNP